MKLLSCVAFVSGVTVGCGARPSVAPAPQIVREVDSARVLVRQLVEAHRLPGFAITVSRGENVVWREGFGFADLNARVPATPETKFRIGSVSKLLTAALLMRLVEQQRVQLDVPVGQYLTLPAPLASVTLRQLAGHLAGVRHYRGNEFLTTVNYSKLRDAVGIFMADSLVAAPGSRYVYSSYGYNLIGAVLEAVTGTSFPGLLRRDVLKPLGMSATVADVNAVSISGRAQTYTVSAQGVAEAPADDLSGRWPSGGLLSSTDDLARLGRSVLAAGFLTESSLRTMLAPQRLTNGTATNVGIGWRISTDSAGRRYLHHGGSSNGGAAFLLVYPDAQLVIAMASNAFTQWGERDALRSASAFLSGLATAFADASVKPSAPPLGAQERGIRLQRGGVLVANGATLRELIEYAYQRHPFDKREVTDGPSWIDSARFDIRATASEEHWIDPDGAPRRTWAMLRTVLAEQFKLQVEEAKRDRLVYVLRQLPLAGSLGPRLQRTLVDCGALMRGDASMPEAGHGPPCGSKTPPGRIFANTVTMPTLASILSPHVDRPVVDGTGLAGRFDVQLEAAEIKAAPDYKPGPSDLALPPAAGPSIFIAIREQLGLTLEPERAPVSVLEIRRVVHPVPD